MAHRTGSRRHQMFSRDAGFAVTHGLIHESASTYRAALKLAVRHVKAYNAVVHVITKDKKRSGGSSVLATCMPKRGFREGDREAWYRSKTKPVACTLKHPVKKRKSKR